MITSKSYGVSILFTDSVDSEIKKSIEKLPNDSLTIIHNKMVDAGYLDVSISQINDTIYIAPSTKYYINRLYVESLMINQNSKPKVFNQVTLEKQIFHYLEQLKNDGFHFARLTIDKIDKNEGKVDIYFKADLGPQLRINNIKYDGLSRTPVETMNRYIRQFPDSILNKSNIEKINEQAKSIDFLDYSPPPKIFPSPGYNKADVVLSFKEKKQALFEGGFGYLPETSIVVWDFDLKFQNVFGQGRKFGLKSDRRNKNKQLFEVSYSQPMFLLSIDELLLSVSTRDYRESFYEFSAEGYYKTTLKNKYYLGLKLGWKSVQPEKNLPDYKIFTLGVKTGYDNLDNRLNPTAGIRMGWSIEYQNRHYKSDYGTVLVENSTINETRNQVEIEYLQKIFYPLISRWQLNYRSLETSESLPPLSELFLLGGSATIRGFNTEQFSALRTAFLNFDLRYRFKSGYLFGFYDIAYLNNHILSLNLDIITEEYYRFGYGFGISLVRNSQLLKISFGWNKDVPFDQPYLTIGISSEI